MRWSTLVLAVAVATAPGCDVVWHLDQIVLPADAQRPGDIDGDAAMDAPACTSFGPPRVSAASLPGSDDSAPAVSPDGSVLVFHRLNGAGGFDLFVATRVGDDFDQAVPIDAANTAADERYPFWSADGTELYFSRGSGDTGGADVLAMGFDGTSFSTPVLPQDFPDLTFPYLVRPRLSSDNLEMFYFADNPSNLYEAVRPAANAPWMTVSLAQVSDGTTTDDGPSISADMLTLYFSSKRTGENRQLYVATRASTVEVFSQAMAVNLVSQPAQPMDPDISRDGRMLVWSAYQQTTSDLYIATRGCQ